MILKEDKTEFPEIISQIEQFLNNNLRLSLHQDKIVIRKLKQGIDFVGYVVLPYYRLLRTKTKRRMFKRVNHQNLPSYLGLLKHCSSHRLMQNLLGKVNIEKELASCFWDG